MQCPNCKKDLVFGYDCTSPACVALRPPTKEATVPEGSLPEDDKPKKKAIKNGKV